jgi:hypothetical protein
MEDELYEVFCGFAAFGAGKEYEKTLLRIQFLGFASFIHASNCAALLRSWTTQSLQNSLVTAEVRRGLFVCMLNAILHSLQNAAF